MGSRIIRQGAHVSDSSKESRDRADGRRDKKQEAQKSGAKAMAEYEATAQATRDKTARLRALRLAKDAADREAGIPAPSATKTVATKSTATKTAAKKATGKKTSAKKVAGDKPALSEWLQAQRDGGHRN
jgi:hypothetical protein